MANRISELMTYCERGLFIVGLAHLNSMTAKLRNAGFEVKAGCWFRIPETAHHVECLQCGELVEVRIERDAKVLGAKN